MLENVLFFLGVAVTLALELVMAFVKRSGGVIDVRPDFVFVEEDETKKRLTKFRLFQLPQTSSRTIVLFLACK